jgi:hypothetical protein
MAIPLYQSYEEHWNDMQRKDRISIESPKLRTAIELGINMENLIVPEPLGPLVRYATIPPSWQFTVVASELKIDGKLIVQPSLDAICSCHFEVRFT